MYCNYKHNKNKVFRAMEEKKNFTFVMSGEQRDALTILSEIEDRSLSKIAEYLIWSGFERYIEQKGLPSALAVKSIEKAYRNMLIEIGAVEGTKDEKAPQSKASVKKSKTDSHLSIATTGLTTVEQWEEICRISGEDVPVDCVQMYNELHKRGDQRFLTNYSKRHQDLVTAYKEDRLEEFLSENQASEEKTAG